MDVIQAIRERHSVRNYADKKIEPEKIEALRAKIHEMNGEGNLHLQFLEDAGKTLLGWDEILDGNLGTQPIVHVWSGDGKDAARKAAANGNRYIISPNKLLYFDWRAEEDPATPGAHGVTSLEKVMAIKPREYEFGDGELLLGGQANVWTEYMPDFATVKKMLFPRVFAMAELWWNGQCEDDLPQRIKEVESLW